ncbi:hypothetical protein GQ44DRAFT_13818 [Phaeosphaeriaceae sp. PMI808]|nr:hypothetical protein GQ44DRAFT_13818 [Phaeosphaeriaceae sp. PMI808]
MVYHVWRFFWLLLTDAVLHWSVNHHSCCMPPTLFGAIHKQTERRHPPTNSLPRRTLTGSNLDALIIISQVGIQRAHRTSRIARSRQTG